MTAIKSYYFTDISPEQPRKLYPSSKANSRIRLTCNRLFLYISISYNLLQNLIKQINLNEESIQQDFKQMVFICKYNIINVIGMFSY